MAWPGRETHTAHRPRPAGACHGDLVQDIPRDRTVKEIFERRNADLRELIVPAAVHGEAGGEPVHRALKHPPGGDRGAHDLAALPRKTSTRAARKARAD